MKSDRKLSECGAGLTAMFSLSASFSISSNAVGALASFRFEAGVAARLLRLSAAMLRLGLRRGLGLASADWYGF